MLLRKTAFSPYPLVFVIEPYSYLKNRATQGIITRQGKLSKDYGRKCCTFGMDGKSSTSVRYMAEDTPYTY